MDVKQLGVRPNLLTPPVVEGEVPLHVSFQAALPEELVLERRGMASDSTTYDRDEDGGVTGSDDD